MILVACGLLREARLIARAGVTVVAGGGDRARLEAALDAAAPRAEAILSIGLAGALVAGLAPGDWVIDGDVAPFAVAGRRGRIVGGDAVVATAAAKAALHRATGADAVDMESHVAAQVARRHGVRFAALRVISDTVDDDLPPAVRAGMRADGAMDVRAVLASLANAPRQLPALVRAGWRAEQGFRALARLASA